MVKKSAPTVTDEALQKFMSLFAGSSLYFITCNVKRPKEKQNVTQHRAYTADDFRAHLEGKMGVGTAPLMTDHSCVFAAIDIDVRDGAEEVDFKSIAARLREAGSPLVMCRTRSGGCHLYLFLRKAAPAKLVRALIAEWAARLQIEGTDYLIPTADYQLNEEGGKPFVSRSVNLPYYDAYDTMRYAFAADGETILTFDEFLAHAEQKAVDPALVMTMPDDPHGQAPPCVQRLMKEGIAPGMRNESLTQIAIYLRRVDTKDVLPRLSAINAQILDDPLGTDEIKKIARSAGRRDYKYRCRSEPCKSLCDSATCLKREYGIKPAEGDENAAADALEELPNIDDIAKVQETEAGGIYRVRINGHSFHAPISRLLSVRDSQALFLEHIGVILPGSLKHGTWYNYITPQIRNARIDIQAPEDTEAGGLRAHIDDFIAGRLKTYEEGTDIMQHRARLDTAPIQEEKEVLFRLSTFERYCRDKRIALPPTQVKTAHLLRRMGAASKRLRTPAGVVGVWQLPYSTDEHEQKYDEIAKPDTNSDY